MGPKVRKLVVALATFSVPLAVAAAATPAAAAGATRYRGTPAVATAAAVDAPTNLVALVNQLRTSVGAAPLATDPTLTNVAQQWANHMAGTGVLFHNPNLATQAPSAWTKIGENIGDGFSFTAIYNALVASPDHYANMVDPAYNRTGAGWRPTARARSGWSEDFGAYPPPPAPTFVFPTSGTIMFPSPQPFSWSQVAGAQYYCVTVGTTRGGVDLVNSGLLPATQLSYTVPGLPGSTPMWARVYSYVQGTWTFADANFSVTGPSTALFTRPTAGATGISAKPAFDLDTRRQRQLLRGDRGNHRGRLRRGQQRAVGGHAVELLGRRPYPRARPFRPASTATSRGAGTTTAT